MTDSPDLSFTGAPAARGRIRAFPEDFQVIENLGFAPSGAGEHAFLRVRKRGANTDWVARQLAGFAKVPARSVSYAGLKDRHAVTEQWFSVHLAGHPEPDWAACGNETFQVLEHARHGRKLRRGTLKSNAFRIVIRDLEGAVTTLEARLGRLSREGMPNYFGEQRFGRGGGNLTRAEAMFCGREKIRDRHKRGLYLSAARSHLFNRVLSQRVAEQTWNQALAGDVVMLEGSHSVFPVTHPNPDICRRVMVLDLHPTGPLWGRGDSTTRGVVEVLERRIAEEDAVLSRGLAQAGLKLERRALRATVSAVELEHMGPGVVAVGFQLPAGAYATSVLRELVALLPDPEAV